MGFRFRKRMRLFPGVWTLVTPPKSFAKFFRHKSNVEAVFIRMSGHATKSLGECFSRPNSGRFAEK
jgi:hypothetical protein